MSFAKRITNQSVRETVSALGYPLEVRHQSRRLGFGKRVEDLPC
jgi:hypothetical protein